MTAVDNIYDQLKWKISEWLGSITKYILSEYSSQLQWDRCRSQNIRHFDP